MPLHGIVTFVIFVIFFSLVLVPLAKVWIRFYFISSNASIHDWILYYFLTDTFHEVKRKRDKKKEVSFHAQCPLLVYILLHHINFCFIR